MLVEVACQNLCLNEAYNWSKIIVAVLPTWSFKSIMGRLRPLAYIMVYDVINTLNDSQHLVEGAGYIM